MRTGWFNTIVFILLFFSLHGERTRITDRPPSKRTASNPGKMWLSWTPNQRDSFILGYLWAYHDGFHSGCREYFDSNPPKVIVDLQHSPLQKCILQELRYSHAVAFYETEITQFYKQFPDDSEVPLPRLLQAFSDSRHESAQQIHTHWSHRDGVPR